MASGNTFSIWKTETGEDVKQIIAFTEEIWWFYDP